MREPSFVKEIDAPMPLFRRVVMLVFLLLLFLGGTLGLDSILLENDPASLGETYAPAVEVDPINGTLPAPYPANERRMFILIVDCLTPTTANNSELMPYFKDYRYNCTYGTAQNAVDAITTPSIRAMFSGKDTVSIFGSTQNWITAQKIPSVFSQLAELNVSISVYSNLPFEQFGDDITDYNFVERDMDRYQELEDEAIEDAIDNYLTRRNDVVILHLLTPHDALHHHGYPSPEYDKAYKNADKVIRRLDGVIGENENLIITGDHGHDEKGHHSFGLDCPTFYTVRGPGFKKNYSEDIAITDIRYYVSWAMGVPLPEEYSAGKHPGALVSRGELPESFDTPDHKSKHYTLEVLKVEREQYPKLLALALYSGILVYLWALMLFDTREQTAWTRLAGLTSLAAVGPMFLFGMSPMVIVPGAAIAATAWFLRTRAFKKDMKRAAKTIWVLPAVLAFLPLGFLMIYGWKYTFYFNRVALYCIWFGIGLLGIYLTRRIKAQRILWWTAVITFFAFLPNIYSKGWMSIMGPLMIAWALWYFWEHRMWPWLAKRAEAKKQGEKPPGFLEVNKDKIQLLMLFGIFFSGFLFFNHRGMNFHFKTWHGLIRWLPFWIFIIMAAFAKLIIFFRPKHSKAAHGVVAVLAALLFIYEIDAFRPHQYIFVAFVAVLGLLALVLRWKRTEGISPIKNLDPEDRRYLSNTFVLAILFLLYYYTIRTHDEYFIWADLMFAGIILAAFYLRRYTDKRTAASGYIFLTFIGFLAAGWVILAWTPTNLEWSFLFDWVPYIFVETDVHLFIPFIVARYLIPLVLIRVALGQILGGYVEYRHRPLLGTIGLKASTIMFTFFGIATFSCTSFFFGAVQEGAMMIILLLGLL